MEEQEEIPLTVWCFCLFLFSSQSKPVGAHWAAYHGEEDAIPAFRGWQALGTIDPPTSLDQGSQWSSKHHDRDEHGGWAEGEWAAFGGAQGSPLWGEGQRTQSLDLEGWQGIRVARSGREVRTLPRAEGAASHCSKEPQAAWAECSSSLPGSVLPSRVCRLAGNFMRTGLFSGVLALSLHVLIGTREAVSANVFVP